jgi:hypothetical protein
MQYKDIKNLMKAGFDLKYAEKWTEDLGITKSFQKCLKEINE